VAALESWKRSALTVVVVVMGIMASVCPVMDLDTIDADVVAAMVVDILVNALPVMVEAS